VPGLRAAFLPVVVADFCDVWMLDLHLADAIAARKTRLLLEKGVIPTIALELRFRIIQRRETS